MGIISSVVILVATRDWWESLRTVSVILTFAILKSPFNRRLISIYSRVFRIMRKGEPAGYVFPAGAGTNLFLNNKLI